MSALHDLLSYVLGFDPRREREKIIQGHRNLCRENLEAHERFRKKLEEDPIKDLLRHIRPEARNGHDDGHKG